MKTIREAVSKSIIVCYKEDISDLENFLFRSDLNPIALRGTYNKSELAYSSNVRAFMNHRNAWKIAASNPDYTLICEADFAPCRNISNFEVFWPIDNPLAWGYLYQGSPRLLSIIGSRSYLRGHCAPLVGYIINQPVAEIMLEFFENQVATFGTEKYFTFDAHLQWWVMGRGAEAYITQRHYGEHGGIPNPEHATAGKVSRAGKHRADNLAGPLAFLPQYAKGSRFAYIRERISGRAYGWARLLTGNWIVDTNVYTRDWINTFRMYWIGVHRLLP